VSCGRTRTPGDLLPLGCLASGADETPSHHRKHTKHTVIYPGSGRERGSRVNPTSNMSELIDEDVVSGCTKASVAAEVSSRPSELANLGLVYSNSSEVKEIARWI
jgi:hypothetical protein